MKYQAFSPTTKKEWLKKVEQDLKGKSLASLDAEFFPGESISPFAHQDDRKGQFGPIPQAKSKNSWEISQSILVSYAKKANQFALAALQQGAEALVLHFETGWSPGQLNALFHQIDLNLIAVQIAAKVSTSSLIDDFMDYLKEENLKSASYSLSFEGNPECYFQEQETISDFVAHCQNLPKAKLLGIHANAGLENESPVEGLYRALQQANTYLESLFDAGLELKEYTHRIWFSYTLGNNYYLNIATLRALRLLWQQLQIAWQIEARIPAFIEAKVSPSSLSSEPDSNLINATSQAMAAVAAGVDRLTTSLGNYQENVPLLDWRISQNIQHILKMESYMDRVVDPAAGSYYLEGFTEQIARQAWKSFQQAPTLKIDS